MSFLGEVSITWWLTLTHLCAAGLGYIMARALTIRAGEAFIHKEEEEESESPVNEKHEYRQVASPLVILLLVAAFVLIGIGTQSYLSQRASDRHDTCVSRWGDELIETVETRGTAANRLETAQNNRDEALDSLLTAAIGIQDQPEQQRQSALADLVTNYVESVDKLRDVQKKTTNTRIKNPFPPLNC